MSSIKFGLVGCGHIGKRHAAVIDHDPVAQLEVVCDIDDSESASLGTTYGVVHTTDFQQLLQHNLDIVSICTPHHLHKSMAMDALNAGFNVLVEKPMALLADDAREMIEVAQKCQRKLFVVKQNRYNVPIILAGKALREGRLGRISMVQCNVFWNRNQGYYDQSDWRGRKENEGGALFTQASHFIDLLVHWFGPVVSAQTNIATHFHDIEVEDAGSTTVLFNSDVIGDITWTTNVYNKNYEGSITIIGETGTVKIGGPYLNKIEFWDVQSYPLPDNISFIDEPNNYGKYQGSSSNHHRVIEEVVKNLQGEPSDIVEGEEGILSIDAIEKIYNAAK